VGVALRATFRIGGLLATLGTGTLSCLWYQGLGIYGSVVRKLWLFSKLRMPPFKCSFPSVVTLRLPGDKRESA
jgi:hypothetical protein